MQGIHHPLVYFPSFFAIKAAVSGQPLSAAVDKYRSEIWDSLKALWMVWVPAQVGGGRLRGGQRGLRLRRGSCRLAGGGALSPPVQHSCTVTGASRCWLTPPLQFVNFAFVPRHLRIPYVAAVSFGWTVILSVMQGKFDAAIQQRQKVVAGVAASGAAAAVTGAATSAPAAPPLPPLLPAAAAAAVQQEAAAAAAAAPSASRTLAAGAQQQGASAAAATSGATTQAVRGLPHSPIVAAAVAEVPAHQGSAVEEA